MTACLIVALPFCAALALTGCADDGPAPVDAEQARAFIDSAEARLMDLWIASQRASWVQSTFITDDTERIAAKAYEDVIAATLELAEESTRFDHLELPGDVERKIKLLRRSLVLPAPRDPAKQEELSILAVGLESDYGKGEYCPEGSASECQDLAQLSRIMATSRDPEELLEAWRGWRTISPPMRPRYERFVELGNEGAQAFGFADLSEMWLSNYDMPSKETMADMERLWQEVRPLYLALHAHVRASLVKHYGTRLVPEDGHIPAHLLGNMWSQSWINIYPLVAPSQQAQGFDLTQILRARKVDERGMVRFGERFFVSLGFDPLPDTFWERSLFTQPTDHDVVCHASAWNIDLEQDLRIKMCIEINEEDFATVHHELGHNFYQRAYSHQPPLFRDSANDAFHEAIGDTVALSVTPSYLQQIGLLDEAPSPDGDLELLMKMALEKVAFLPFGLLVDQWRWKVFTGEISSADYNKSWWDLRRKYQGIDAPVPRSEADFDPGAKYHIPANTPYSRYFFAHILQFQFHRALCKEAGYEGPLHHCSIYDNAAAGERLKKTLKMGMSRPWPEALEALTGERRMDATALLDYFAPLTAWLDEHNQDRPVGF
ncbi:MAG: M2 family metallopeptidase [Acidobacteria bacterium]|nr:M2 family metallopeptidase [Acidobacteriota bacterium]